MPIQGPKLFLLSHSNNVSGFVDNKLELYARYDSSLEQILNNMNQYRSPTNQINRLYNKFGTAVPLNLKIKETMYLYIDTSDRPYVSSAPVCAL